MSRRSGIASSTAAPVSASRSSLDEEVQGAIRELVALAPLHNAPALEAIEAAQRALPGVPHVAVFDTAFHATIPEEAATYAVPRRWREDWGVRRYGFHGLSVQWAAEQRAACRASSSATSAAAARSRPCATAARSTRRWASARSRACR